MIATKKPLSELYEADETAWLETMSRLARRGDIDQLDLPNLAEYLSDMARRDRREVDNRLALVISHLLKWQYQPAKRSRSWRTTVLAQRQKLIGSLDSGTLANHAETVLPKVYANGLALAIEATGMPASAFPATCPFSIDDIIKGIDLSEPYNGK